MEKDSLLYEAFVVVLISYALITVIGSGDIAVAFRENTMKATGMAIMLFLQVVVVFMSLRRLEPFRFILAAMIGSAIAIQQLKAVL